MVGDKYILEPEAILDHCVAAEGKRWYLVKWKPKWVKKHELPEGVYEKWEEKKAKRAKLELEGKADEPEPEEEESGFRILEERRLVPGQEPEEEGKVSSGILNGNGDDEEEDEDEDDEGLDDEELDEDEDEDELDEEDEENMDDEEDEDLEGVEVKEEPEDEDEDYINGVGSATNDQEDLHTLSSVDRDIVLNGLPGDMDLKEEAEIKEEEDRISIPKNYTKPYS